MFAYKPTSITIQTFSKLKKLPSEVKAGMRRGLYTSGKLLTRDLTSEMTKRQVTGRRYKVYVGIGGRKLLKPRTHTASRPNELPAIITGSYRKSISFNVNGSTRMTFGSRDYAKKYARRLEKRNQPIKRTADKNHAEIKQIINQYITVLQ